MAIDIAFSGHTLGVVADAYTRNKRIEANERQAKAQLQESGRQFDTATELNREQFNTNARSRSRELTDQMTRFREELEVRRERNKDLANIAEEQLDVEFGKLNLLDQAQRRADDLASRRVSIDESRNDFAIGQVKKQELKAAQAQQYGISKDIWESSILAALQRGDSQEEILSNPEFADQMAFMVNDDPVLEQRLQERFGIQEFTLMPNPATAEMDADGNPIGSNGFTIGVIGKDGEPDILKNPRGEPVNIPNRMLFSLANARFGGGTDYLGAAEAEVQRRMKAAGLDGPNAVSNTIMDEVDLEVEEREQEKGGFVNTLKSITGVNAVSDLFTPGPKFGSADQRERNRDRNFKEERTQEITEAYQDQIEDLETQARQKVAGDLGTLRTLKSLGPDASTLTAIQTGAYENSLAGAQNKADFDALKIQQQADEVAQSLLDFEVRDVVTGLGEATAAQTESGWFQDHFNDIDIYQAPTPEKVEAKMQQDISQTVRNHAREFGLGHPGFEGRTDFRKWERRHWQLAANIVLASRVDSFTTRGDVDDPDQMGIITRGQIRRARNKLKVTSSPTYIQRYYRRNNKERGLF